MRWDTLDDTLYVFGPINRAEDVLIKEITPGFYEVTPLEAGAFVTIREGERFRVFVFSGIRWITE